MIGERGERVEPERLSGRAELNADPQFIERFCQIVGFKLEPRPRHSLLAAFEIGIGSIIAQLYCRQ